MKNKLLAERLLMRFLRGAISGAVSSMTVILPFSVDATTTWNDVFMWLNLLVIAGLIGFISGGLLAIDLYIRNK